MPRNSSGTYTLPAGNPVVPNTLIDTNWANPTMSDLGAAITDSLDRFGRGGMLAQLKLADGTVTQPAFAFNSESSTGLYRPAAGVFNVAVLGTLIASFAAASVTFSQQPKFAGAPAVAADLVNKAYVDGATSGVYLPLTGGTLAGPGNLAVSGTLGVNGISTFAAGVIHNTTTSLVGITTASAQILGILGVAGTPGFGFVGDTNTGIWSPGADLFAISTGGVQAVTVDASQNVGIGVGAGTPFSRLEIAGASPSLTVTGSTNAAFRGLRIRQSGTEIATLFAEANAGELRQTAGFAGFGGFWTLYTNGVERIRADASGNVGIGKTASGYKLDVAGPLRLTPVDGPGPQIGINLYDPGTGAGEGLILQWESGSRTDMARIYALGNSTAGGDLIFSTNAANGGSVTDRMKILASGQIIEATTNQELGYKDIPRTTGGFARGQCFAVSAGQTINTSSPGYTYSVYNDSAANVTLTQGAGLTLRLNGTATTGNRTLLARGFATFWFNSASECVISGAVT